MSADLAARIEAALDEKQRIAEEWGVGQVGWITYRLPDGGMNYTTVAARQHADAPWVVDGHPSLDHASESAPFFDPQDSLRQVAGMREILDGHSDVSDDNHAGVCACEFDWPCPTVRSLASMLGVDEGEK